MLSVSGRIASVLVIAQVGDDLRAALASRFALVDHVLEGAAIADGPVPRGHDIVLTRAIVGLPAAVLDVLAPGALVISYGAGTEKLDFEAAHRAGVTIVNTRDELTGDVAEYAIGLIFAARRGILDADAFVRAGRWGTEAARPTRRVGGSRVGVFGLGAIGLRVAELATVIGMDVHYASPRRTDERFVRHPDILSLATAADVLVLCAPGTPETCHAVDATVLATLGPSGILVNVARGSLVDQDALVDALERGVIAGAALDVFNSEPAINPRLRTLSNVILSPHAAANTVEARAAAINRLVATAVAHVNDRREDLSEMEKI